MTKVIKEVDWNGHHYTFTNTYKNTGAKSHDILTMEDEEGNSYTGEVTWSNRPWHRFDLEEAFTEIVSKAFGPEAKKLILEINETARDVEDAIDEFFSRFNPEDITANTVEKEDDSEDARKNALAKFLEINADEIESNGNNEFTCDSGTYLVLTDEEAEDEFDASVRSLWDDLGIDEIGDASFKERIIEYATDEDELKGIVEDEIRYSIEEGLEDEEVVARCVDEGIVEEESVYDEDGFVKDDVDIDDLREKLIEQELDSVDSYYEYLEDVGYPMENLVDYIDEDKVVEVIKDEFDVNGGGRGGQLASYDGVEEEQDGFYIYRID